MVAAAHWSLIHALYSGLFHKHSFSQMSSFPFKSSQKHDTDSSDDTISLDFPGTRGHSLGCCGTRRRAPCVLDRQK